MVMTGTTAGKALDGDRDQHWEGGMDGDGDQRWEATMDEDSCRR